jgi:hypothetical protein
MKKKYMVIINRQAMVQVEATSNAAAEHKVLDEIKHFVKSALAFDPATEAVHYAWAFEKCNITTFAEAKNKAHQAFARLLINYNELLEEKSNIEDKIRKLEDDLAIQKHLLETARFNAEQFRKENDLQTGFTAPEKIAELMLA